MSFFVCMGRFNIPSSYVVPSDRGISFKEKIPLVSRQPNCIAVALTANLHRCSRGDTRNLVDFKMPSIFPNYFFWKEKAVLSK